jgi:hypothetical protein
MCPFKKIHAAQINTWNLTIDFESNLVKSFDSPDRIIIQALHPLNRSISVRLAVKIPTIKVENISVSQN